MGQQPTIDISSSFASRNHVAHAVVNCPLYSLDKRRSPLTIEDGAPGPVGANVKQNGPLAGSQLLSLSTPALWRRRTASANRPDIEHSLPFAGNVGSILPLSSRVGVKVDEGSAGQLLVLPGASAPGCRFAGRIIEGTSGKLANVWSPDAVNDAGGRDDCAVFVAPRRPGP
jgi:hypothetical protein